VDIRDRFLLSDTKERKKLFKAGDRAVTALRKFRAQIVVDLIKLYKFDAIEGKIGSWPIYANEMNIYK
jgi:hypothetical protein